MNYNPRTKKVSVSSGKIKKPKKTNKKNNKGKGQNLYALSGTILLQNGGMVYELSLHGRLLNFLYELGFSCEYAMVKIMRNIAVVFGIIGDLIAEYLGKSLGRFFGLIAYGLREFAAPFSTIIRAIGTINTIIVKEKHYGGEHVRIRIKGYILTGIKKHIHLTSNPFCYILPVGALCVFIYTATTMFGYNFVLRVYNNELMLGYIESAKVMDEAQQEVSARIQYQSDGAEWSVAPAYSIAVAEALPSDTKTQDTTSLANNIILSSGEEIQESTGLFVDGRFYGATQDKIQLENDINSLLDGYTRNTEGTTVGFVQDVEMVDGLFLSESVVAHSDIQSLITSQTGETTEKYTVLAGESVTDISVKFSLTSGELAALNPDVDFAELEEGDQLTIRRNVSFLTVKEVEQIVYEEEVAFQIVQEADPSLRLSTVETKVEGESGLNRITADVTYIDGVEVSVDIVNTEVLKEPVNEVILVGTALGSGGINYDGPALGSGSMVWPTGPGTGGISRGFSGSYAHNGIDIWGAHGTPIYAVDAGVVVQVQYSDYAYGIMCLVDHGNGIMSRYAHNSSLNVSLGDSVSQGQMIAGMGSTGNSTGNHLHFEIILNGTTVDPAPYIS